MDRVLAFGRFWRDFVVGDDWTIAVTIAWALAATFELNQSTINAWYVLPLVVGVKVWLSTRQVLFAKHPEVAPKKHPTVRTGTLWLAACSVTVLPLLAFRVKNTDFTLAHFVLPILFNLIVTAVLAIVLAKPYRLYPLATSLVLLAVSIVVIVNRLQEQLQTLSENIDDMSAPTRILITTATAAAAVLAFWYLTRPENEKRVG